MNHLSKENKDNIKPMSEKEDIYNLEFKVRTFKPGDEVEGKIVLITSENIYVDIGAKMEATIDPEELYDPQNAKPIRIGDKIKAYVAYITPYEIRLSKALGLYLKADEFLMNAYKEGVPVQGLIKKRIKGGFEVTVMGKRAFLPQSHLDINPVNNYDSFVGKILNFKVIEYSEKDDKLVLSRSLLIKEEIQKAIEQKISSFKIGQIVSAKVENIKPFGVFLDVSGIEGFIPISELSWIRVENPEDIVELGQTINAKILDIIKKKDNYQIILSLKATQKEPWEIFISEYKEGDIIEGKIIRILPFGAFVQLKPGVDGLVHISEMTWDKGISHPKEIVKIGDIVKVRIINIDKENKKIALSMKDVEDDPWNGVEQKFPLYSLVKGTVSKIMPFGIFVKLDKGITALLPLSEIPPLKGDIAKNFPQGKEIEAEVIYVSEDERKITLSQKTLILHQQEKEYQDYMNKLKSENEEMRKAFTLGEILKKKLKLK